MKLLVLMFLISTSAAAAETVRACCACKNGTETKEVYEISEASIKEARAACTAGNTADLKCVLVDLLECK